MQYHNGESDEDEEEEEEQEDDGGDDEQDIKTQISAYFNVFLQSCNAFHESVTVGLLNSSGECRGGGRYH